MIEDYQILIIGSMVAGYILLRAFEGVITSIRRMKKDKAHENYDKLVEKVEEERNKFEKRFDIDTRRLKKI